MVHVPPVCGTATQAPSPPNLVTSRIIPGEAHAYRVEEERGEGMAAGEVRVGGLGPARRHRGRELGGRQSARWGSEAGKEARRAGAQLSGERREHSGVRERGITCGQEADARMNRRGPIPGTASGCSPKHVSARRSPVALRPPLSRCIRVRVCF